jgi:antitoxin VapB
MTKATEKRAKLFKNGASQAVRLPKEFRFEGTEVRIRRVKEGVLLEPLTPQIAKADWATVRKVLKSLGPESAEMMEATIQKLQAAEKGK